MKPFFCLHHRAQGGPGAVENAIDVHVYSASPFLVGEVPGVASGGVYAGVVDQDIESTKLLYGEVDEGVGLLTGVAGVHDHANGLGAHVLNLGDGPVGGLDVSDDDLDPGPCEDVCDSAPYALGCAGNYGDFPGDV